jgi:antitoxin ParD1/3/4
MPGFSVCQDHATLSLPEVSMASLTISLPDAAKDWIDEQVRSGRYASAGDYLSELVVQERVRRGEELSVDELRDLLAASRGSGVSSRTVAEILDEAKSIVSQRKVGRA